VDVTTLDAFALARLVAAWRDGAMPEDREAEPRAGRTRSGRASRCDTASTSKLYRRPRAGAAAASHALLAPRPRRSRTGVDRTGRRSSIRVRPSARSEWRLWRARHTENAIARRCKRGRRCRRRNSDGFDTLRRIQHGAPARNPARRASVSNGRHTRPASAAAVAPRAGIRRTCPPICDDRRRNDRTRCRDAPFAMTHG